MDLVPPIELISGNNVGVHDKQNIVSEYTKIGTHIFKRLEQSAGLKPSSHVLDVGCGTGRVASPMANYLESGSYKGIDIVESSVLWCKNAFRDFENFEFLHADVFSKFYNPQGQYLSENYTFPFPDNSFDVIWSSSLFTHMLIGGVDNYLKEMSRVAKPGAYVWNTYLLLDEITEPLVLGPRNDGRRMKFPVDGGRIGYKDRPEFVVGLYKERIEELHAKHGLKITRMTLSNWSGGRAFGFKGQDVIIAVKA